MATRPEKIVDGCRETQQDLELQPAHPQGRGEVLLEARPAEDEEVEEGPETAVGACAELGAPALVGEEAEGYVD